MKKTSVTLLSLLLAAGLLLFMYPSVSKLINHSYGKYRMQLYYAEKEAMISGNCSLASDEPREDVSYINLQKNMYIAVDLLGMLLAISTGTAGLYTLGIALVLYYRIR